MARKINPEFKPTILWASLFSITSILVGFGITDSFDYWFMSGLNSLAMDAVDRPLSCFSMLGAPEFSSIMTLVFALILWKKTSFRSAVHLCAIFTLITALELVFKFSLATVEIPVEFGRNRIGFSMMHLNAPHSYPSGHTFRSVFLILVGLSLAKAYWRSLPGIKTAKYIGALIIAGICISRVYLGEHWPMDVVGSVFLALMG
ncbi:phosphatase PAP2 family protein, partial [Elusimicrobiota bacterium]